MTSTPEIDGPEAPADERLLAAEDLARAALAEFTSAESVGSLAGHTVDADGVVSLRFHNRLAGYPGWLWTVSLARVEDADPTVLEVELLPGEGALLAPDWVPWAVRLAEYQAAQKAAADGDDDEDDLDDEDDNEEDGDDEDSEDDDLDASPILHAGDLDGVDIDELDDDADEDDEDASDIETLREY